MKMNAYQSSIGFLALVVTVPAWSASGPPAAPSPVPAPPVIQSLVKPAIWTRVHDDREVRAYSNLDGDQYTFYAVMIADASLARTKEVLTDYRLYAKMVPYIQKADFDPATNNLKLMGGVWHWYLASMIHFSEKSDRWVHFDVVQGHFRGLSGDIFFEKMPDKGTAVMIRGSQVGKTWPPKLILERGAEIVFAKRMRSYLESK
jgi:hypothetical protein